MQTDSSKTDVNSLSSGIKTPQMKLLKKIEQMKEQTSSNKNGESSAGTLQNSYGRFYKRNYVTTLSNGHVMLNSEQASTDKEQRAYFLSSEFRTDEQK